jgi:hypothetical protein
MPAFTPKMLAAALMVVMLAANAAFARSVDTISPDDTARFLAGLPPPSDSPLAALANDPAWRQHARHFDSIFGREESTKLSKIREFSRDRLTEKHDTLLYMFSGPDFLYATSFFPSATTYVLSGLEPVGDVPQLTGLTRPAVEQTLHNLENSLSSILNFSFFITRNMKTQLSEGPVYGTLPVLYIFLARTGKTIHEVSVGSLDAEGNFLAANELGLKGVGRKIIRDSAGSAAKGVKIVFSDGDGRTQTLYYFSTNLADGAVRRSGFLAFCAKLGVADSFIKSASYLLHTGGFNTVRNVLLDQSATILQDDSGIPLAYFDPRKWRLQPFGQYVGPLHIFGANYQARLGELFRKGNAIPLDFGIGYRWRRNESNLLLAEKIAPRTSEGELGEPLPTDRYSQQPDTKPAHKVRAAVGSPQSRRNRVDGEPTGSLGCGILGIFSFCSVPPPKSSQ